MISRTMQGHHARIVQQRRVARVLGANTRQREIEQAADRVHVGARIGLDAVEAVLLGGCEPHRAVRRRDAGRSVREGTRDSQVDHMGAVG